MPKPTPSPKVKDRSLLVVPYGYASFLAALALVQLIGFGGFDFAGISYETKGSATMVMLLSGVEIFALPFLLRLSLSKLARACSASLSLVAPILLFAYIPVLGLLLAPLAVGSFVMLNGAQVFRR